LRRLSQSIVRPWVFAGLLAGVLWGPVVAGHAVEPATEIESASSEPSSTAQSWQELGRHPGDGEQCLVCSQRIEGETAVEIRYKGRVFYVKQSMLDTFRADPDAYFRKLQARSGLFDEAAMEGPSMHKGWLWAGVYVAIGLLFGALCASIALGRGRSAPAWFFAGLVGNVVAVAVLLVRTSAADAPVAAERLGFLGRVASTRAPRTCPRCGASNHPSAEACSSCGTGLEPLAPSETDLLDLEGAP